jgi:hypothetical protein
MKVVVIGRPRGPRPVCSKVEPLWTWVGMPVVSIASAAHSGYRAGSSRSAQIRSTGASMRTCCCQEAATEP